MVNGCPMIRMGVSGWMFLLVPAYPGSPGPKAFKWLCVCVCNPKPTNVKIFNMCRMWNVTRKLIHWLVFFALVFDIWWCLLYSFVAGRSLCWWNFHLSRWSCNSAWHFTQDKCCRLSFDSCHPKQWYISMCVFFQAAIIFCISKTAAITVYMA